MPSEPIAPAADLDMRPLFFYGTLRDPDLLARVTGRADLAGVSVRTAHLPGAHVSRVLGESFPMVFPDKTARAEGVLVEGLNPTERARVKFFEDADYALTPIDVEVDGRLVGAAFYQPTERLRDSGEPWSFEAWVRDDKALLMACATEQLRFFGALDQAIVETLWPEVKVAAERRIGQPPVSLRSPLARSDVEEIARVEPYRQFFSVTEVDVAWRRYDGAPAKPYNRSAFRIGEVVVVLPYDPRRDEVVLIEQWRVGPWVADDPAPWHLEVVAGRVEPGEDPEATARRETLEEAGVEVRRLELASRFYSSPGATDEFVHAFIAEADLSEAGGHHGLAAEGEDIRVVRTPYWAAMEAMARGEIQAGPALVALLWLGRHRDRICFDWG